MIVKRQDLAMELLLSLLFCFLVAAPAKAANRPCNPQDSQSLLLFKSSIVKDTNGVLSGWKNSTDCCRSWSGVTCNRGRVIKLKLSVSDLRGPIPESLGHLTQLLILDLSNNGFHGSIPGSLGSLLHLTTLDLSYNHLTGNIPQSLTKLSALQKLDLAYNHGLSGPLPDKIGELRSLVRVRLQSNKFTGKIPSSFGKLNQLVYLELDDNLLEGPVPDGFTEHTSSLAFLVLSKNKITALPKNLSNLKRLGILYLDSNPLSFHSIAGIATLPFLGELHLNNASLAGSIPNWLANLNLRQSDDFVTCSLDLSSNVITGKIPPVLGNMTSLENLQLKNNKLSGEIPKSLLQLSLRWFNVSNNKLTGQIPQGEPFISFDKSAFAGNSGLCGRPLPACTNK